MEYNELIQKLESVDIEACFPIYIPSHFRPGHFFYKEVIQKLPKDFKKNKVHYIIRDEMYKSYKEAQPDVDIVVIPKEIEYPGYGIDTTRKFIYDYALENGDTYIFDFDDDNRYLTMCFGCYEAGTTRRLRKAEREKYALNILAFASKTALEAFKKYKSLCFGTFGTIQPTSCEKDHHNQKLVINKGPVPRQGLIYNLKRMKRMGIERTGIYDIQHEDQGLLYKTLMHGGWVFYFPTILRKTEPASDDKNPRTEVLLHKKPEEFLWEEGLKIMYDQGIKPEWVRWKTHSDGRKSPFGINWRNIRKDYPELISITEEW